MIICPNCLSKEADGSIYCSECGAKLNIASTVTTQKIETTERNGKLHGDTTPFQPPPPEKLDAWASLHMMETGQIIPLSDRMEFTLGRVVDGQPVMPDVDLTQYNAYANGVSRLHAVLKRGPKGALLTDLSSSNGTYVNGNRIPPHVEQSIKHGDLIYLGKLKFQVLLGQGA